jgi:BACON domain-containing protein/fibronectin type III domain protein
MKQPKALVKRTGWIVAGILGLLLPAGEISALPYSPATLTFTASQGTTSPPAQTVTFSTKKSFVPKNWTAMAATSWLLLSPTSGTISAEQDTISVQVNVSGLSAGTYISSFNIAVTGNGKKGGTQTATIPVTFIVSSGTTTSPSILLNPVNLSFLGTAGGTAPLAKTINLTNPTGGRLTWSLTESASWLGLNVTSGTTTTEVDTISASVSTTGLVAGTYNTAINVAASGASNNPQIIPVTLTLSASTSTGTASLTWNPNTETDLAGYKIYMGIQPGIYGAPISLGLTTSYTTGNLTTGKTYYFSITSFDSAGNESQHSSEVSKPIL